MNDLFEYLATNGNAIRNIRVCNDGQTFVLDDAGYPAMIVGLDDGDGVYDAVAYLLSDPCKWWTALGQGTVLGEVAILYATDTGQPVELVATPQEWLRRTTCEGAKFACLLRWDIDPRLNLGWVRRVRCESDELRNRLEDAIARHRVPFVIETNNPAVMTAPEARHAA